MKICLDSIKIVTEQFILSRYVTEIMSWNNAGFLLYATIKCTSFLKGFFGTQKGFFGSQKGFFRVQII